MNDLTSRINLPHTELILYTNNILEIKTGDNYFYSLIDVKEILQAIIEISDGKKKKILILPGEYSDCDIEARKFITSNEVCDEVSAFAIIPSSLAQRLLTSFIINFDKPSVPAKSFHSVKKGIEWLIGLS